MTSLLWLRRDLRLSDHPALAAAAAASSAGDVVPLFVIDPRLWQRAGGVRRAWLAASLRALPYADHLVLRVGDPRTVVPQVAREIEAAGVHVSTETSPYGRGRDASVRDALGEVEWVETGSPYAVTPGRVVNKGGTPFKVFTPFSRAWAEHGWRAPADPGRPRWAAARSDAEAGRLLDDALKGDLPDLPPPGEGAARARWAEFLDHGLDSYDTDRDRPDLNGTSGLSPYLKVGAIHPRTLLADLARRRSKAAQRFRTEIAWREFYADVLFHRPDSAWQDWRPLGIEYDDPGPEFDAWSRGRTGFPIVDAGMRQLLACGWMHNRVRMITASFLTKDLHVWWPHGARFFLDHLVDGDVASNNHGWQWTAGTGTDASPYFRVFNPVTQGLKFDPTGDYVRRWVPELADLPGKAAHEPWRHGGAPGYPDPIVDHGEERTEALRRYDARSQDARS